MYVAANGIDFVDVVGFIFRLMKNKHRTNIAYNRTFYKATWYIYLNKCKIEHAIHKLKLIIFLFLQEIESRKKIKSSHALLLKLLFFSYAESPIVFLNQIKINWLIL